MFSAEVHNHLTARYSAAIRYAGVPLLGKLADKRIAARQIGNLVLLRRSRFCRFAERVAVIISRYSARKRFLRLQSGHVDGDSTEAAEVAMNGHGDRTVDACLDRASPSRNGSLVRSSIGSWPTTWQVANEIGPSALLDRRTRWACPSRCRVVLRARRDEPQCLYAGSWLKVGGLGVLAQSTSTLRPGRVRRCQPAA